MSKRHKVEGYDAKPEIDWLQADTLDAWRCLRATLDGPEQRIGIGQLRDWCELMGVRALERRRALFDDVLGLEDTWRTWSSGERSKAQTVAGKGVSNAHAEARDRRARSSLGSP
ncbi:MAG: hypothetical protein DRH08_00120 [Deltaproteobacteria bacterium]|nr:MAG: hypothetical protein DRH08_00120 [Deltaproteobacteria bacterium]